MAYVKIYMVKIWRSDDHTIEIASGDKSLKGLGFRCSVNDIPDSVRRHQALYEILSRTLETLGAQSPDDKDENVIPLKH